jgi:hypothetical protein
VFRVMQLVFFTLPLRKSYLYLFLSVPLDLVLFEKPSQSRNLFLCLWSVVDARSAH